LIIFHHVCLNTSACTEGSLGMILPTYILFIPWLLCFCDQLGGTIMCEHEGERKGPCVLRALDKAKKLAVGGPNHRGEHQLPPVLLALEEMMPPMLL
jgi:hypothetical protein